MPTRSDWLETGLAAVVDDGPNGLRIDRLCRRLGVSKGSFHHHFAGAGDFKRSLLAAYEDLVVKALDHAIDQTEAATPQAALAGLTAAITGTPGLYRPELEVAMRADRQRLASLHRIGSKIVDDPAEAHTASLLPYLVGIGASLVQPPIPPDQLRRVYELLLGLVPTKVEHTYGP